MSISSIPRHACSPVTPPGSSAAKTPDPQTDSDADDADAAQPPVQAPCRPARARGSISSPEAYALVPQSS